MVDVDPLALIERLGFGALEKSIKRDCLTI